MEFRVATPADVPALARMNKRLIEDEEHRNPMNVAELEARMAGWLARGEYVAVLFGDAAGYALYRRESDHIYLRQFYVERALRRQGIGRAAMVWLRSHAWKDLLVRVSVLVQNERGLAFWRAIGFRDYSLTLEMRP